MTPLNHISQLPTMPVFSPAIYTPSIIQRTIYQVPSMCPFTHWNVETDLFLWPSKSLLHQATLWMFSPFVAQRAIRCALMSWVESPLDSDNVFLVPRVLQRNYGQVNKNVNLLGQFHPLSPACGPQPCAVSFLIFHLPRFRRQLDPKGTGLDNPPPHGPRAKVGPSANGMSVRVVSGRSRICMDSVLH
jgi:hypothetical protein